MASSPRAVENIENSLEKIKCHLASAFGKNLLQGPLLKRSETLRKWSEHWVILGPTTGRMEYKFRRNEPTVKGTIIVGHHRKKDYFLCAETAGAARAWESTLQYSSEDSDGDYCRDSSSEGSVSSQMSALSIHEKRNIVQEGFSSDDSETGNPQDLLFEYLEQDPPYSREPLADKILDLARHYPALKSLRSCDLLPISWMSVAWYPIYRIPTGPTLKDLDACFLTYHTLHTPLTGSGPTHGPTLVYPSEMDGVPNISIPTFAMAAYKLKGSIWMKKGVGESQVVNSLLQAADNWLRVVQVNHPDFQFFKSHGTCYR